MKILAIHVVNVAIVTIRPSWRPGINKHKRIAAGLEAWPALHYLRPMRGEVMLSTELGAEPVVRNAAAISTRTCIILLATLLSSRFLSAFFRSSRFLSPRFLSPCFRPPCFLPARFLL
jgi:hypothetical protein